MTAKWKVLYLNRATEAVYEIIRSRLPLDFELVTLSTGNDEELPAAAAEADFFLGGNVTAELIAAAPRLKLIQCQGVGYDKVDLMATTQAGVPVAITPQGTIAGVAEHTILLILAVYKQLPRADASLRRGEWWTWALRPTCFELQGKMLGIVGLGRIGRAVARRARAFDARLIYYDPLRPDPELEAALEVAYRPFEDLLTEADIVSLHVPLTERTEGMIGAAELARMKPSAIFINTARGKLVDEAALVAALREGRLTGAGLDVFADEPLGPDNPLLTLDNVVLTPHIAAGTRDALVAKMDAAFANMRRVIRGEPPIHVITPT